MRVTALVFAGLFAAAAPSEGADLTASADIFREADMTDLSEFVWTKRPIIVFADTAADPRFQQQMDLLEARVDELAKRDVVVLTDTDPASQGALRRKLRPRGFALVLIGKDGGVKLRKPFPWDVRELSRVIDKMPMRQREIRERARDSDG